MFYIVRNAHNTKEIYTYLRTFEDIKTWAEYEGMENIELVEIDCLSWTLYDNYERVARIDKEYFFEG